MYASCACSHKFTNLSLQCQSCFTWFGSKADIVMFKNVTQNEPAAAVNSTFWADSAGLKLGGRTVAHGD